MDIKWVTSDLIFLLLVIFIVNGVVSFFCFFLVVREPSLPAAEKQTYGKDSDWFS